MDPPDQEADGKAELAIGIDLGTTYSAVACVDESGKPFSIRNQDGDLLTATAVLIDDQDIVIGREAVSASVMEPQSFADCFKRDVGSPTYRRGLCGVQIPPQVLNAFVLEQLKNDAERRIGAVSKAVITVPAFFDETRRKATQDAGRLAGIEVLDIINEPTAAALAYGYQHGLLNLDKPNTTSTRVLVYDLGGGTFDVTILEVSGTRYRAVATDGDVQLGGKDFDERLVEFFAETFVEEHGIDPRSDPRDAAQLWIDAQRAKHTLSHRSKTSTVVSHAGMRSNIELRREQFEQLTRDLLERTETTTSLVLREAGHSWREIDRILLVGGSSRMPAVTDMLQRVSGKEVDRSLSPDEAIAHGAALHAAMMTRRGHAAFADCQLINVNSHSLGVRGIDPQTQRRVNAIMIPKNTPLPCKQAKTFSTAQNDQRSVKVVVLEGESRRPDDCIQLGDCVIRDLPPGLPQGSKIEVTYSYEPNGRVTVAARMPQTRQSARVAIRRSNAVELEDLESWRRRLLSQGNTPAAAVDLSDPGSVLRRLDELYSDIGLAAMDGKVPATVTHYQSAAQSARTTFKAAETAAKQVAGKKQAAISRAEAVRLSTQIAKCQSKLEQTETRYRFSCIVLGRECVKHSHVPAGVAEQAAEATQLRRRLAV